jgi:hypothetical protein
MASKRRKPLGPRGIAAAGSTPTGRQKPRIVLDEPGYVELSDADRRDAVAIFASILAAWWQRQTDAEQDLPAYELGQRVGREGTRPSVTTDSGGDAAVPELNA